MLAIKRSARVALSLGNHPTDDVAAENIHDDVKVEVRPLNGSQQFGDVPRPHLIWASGEQFGFGNWGGEVVTSFPHLVVFLQNAVHGSNGAKVIPSSSSRVAYTAAGA